MTDFNFDLFDLYQEQEEITQPSQLEKEILEECEHSMRLDNFHNVCINCGLTEKDHSIYQDPSNVYESHNPSTDRHFLWPTIIKGYNVSLRRIHIWQNSDNRRVFIGKCNNIILDICKEFELQRYEKYIDNEFRDIYMYDDVRTRGKIKTSIFLYFLYNKSIELNDDIDILEIMRYCKVSILNYNNAIDKLMNEVEKTKVTPLYIPVNINKYFNLLGDIKNNIVFNDFIISFNEKLKEHHKTRPDSITKVCIYNYLLNNGFTLESEVIVKFLTTFNISSKLLNKLI